MNKKVLFSGAACIILAVSAVFAVHFMLPPQQPDNSPQNGEPNGHDQTPNIPEPIILEKPKFHPFNVYFRFSGGGVFFNIQNVGNVTATQVNVTITVHWGSGIEVWSWINDIETRIYESDTYTVSLPKLEAKEVNEFSAQIDFHRISTHVSLSDETYAVSEYIFLIVCLEGVEETITLQG